MSFIRLSLLLIIIFISPFSIAKNQSFYYEPKIVKLSGIIKILTFPGQPNYESIKKGDADETGPYLILNNPIDIDVITNSRSNNDPEKNVGILQLIVLNNNDWKKIKEDNYVSITGTLSHALTGHHHTRVLITVENIVVISQQKLAGNKLDITEDDKKFMRHEHLQTSVTY